MVEILKNIREIVVSIINYFMTIISFTFFMFAVFMVFLGCLSSPLPSNEKKSKKNDTPLIKDSRNLLDRLLIVVGNLEKIINRNANGIEL